MVLIFQFFYMQCFAVDDDFASQVPLPYVKKRLGSISKKWSKIQELIVEREHQLEINGGSIQTFFESLQAMTDWIEGKLKLEILASPPPANLTALKEHLQLLKVSGADFHPKTCMYTVLKQLFTLDAYFVHVHNHFSSLLVKSIHSPYCGEHWFRIHTSTVHIRDFCRTWKLRWRARW